MSNAQQEYLQLKSMKSQSDMFGLTFSPRGSVTVVTKDQIAQTVKEKKKPNVYNTVNRFIHVNVI